MAEVTRREALTVAGTALAGAALAPGASAAPEGGRIVQKGRIKQSVCRWCYEKIPMPEFVKAVAGMGLTAMDLVDEKDWGLLADHGLVCSMAWKTSPGGIPDGLNDPKNHDSIVNGLIDAMPRAKKAGVPNLIAFFGNRKGMARRRRHQELRGRPQSGEEGGRGARLNICVELLNSKVDHKDYQGDRTWFGVEVVKRVESPRVRLLYDIYHMQIMEGDVMRTIRDNHQWIAHYHTGGVPGRHELDDTQELNWRTVAKTIADTGFQRLRGPRVRAHPGSSDFAA